MGHAQLDLTRRDLLKASAGTALLLMSWDLVGKPSVSAAASTPPPFFLYGLPGPGSTSSVAAGVTPAAGASAAPPTLVTAGLAATPLKSQDQSALGLIHLTGTDPGASLGVTVLSMASGSVIAAGDLPLPNIQQDASVTVAPAFTPDASVLAIVISIMSPSNWQTITKAIPDSSEPLTLRAATWTAHHEVAYFTCASGAFTGPLDLGDAPSLPRCTVVASNSDLYIWTAADPNHRGPQAPWPTVVPQLSVYPLGSGAPRLTVPAPGPWPVGEPVLALDSGDILRFLDADHVERRSASTGVGVSVPLADLRQTSARPPAPAMQLLADGSIFLSNPTIGRAVIAPPGDIANPRSVITFPVPMDASGGGSKVALSPDGHTLYAVGSHGVGGLAAYDVQSGSPVASYADSAMYSAVQVLPSGAILGASVNPLLLKLFDSSLHLMAAVPSPVIVTAIY